MWLRLSGHHIPSLDKPGLGHKAGAWQQDLKQRLWGCASHWLVPRDLLCFFSCVTEDPLLRDGTTHSGPGPYTLAIDQENKVTGMIACSQLRLALPDDSGLCQVGKTKQNKQLVSTGTDT